MATDPIDRDIETLARLEREALDQRNAGERLSDSIVGAVGTLAFAAGHLVVIGAWILANTGGLPGVTPFDPFPFGILALLVATEGVFLALFILISQNRMNRQGHQRSHLNLQITALAEREATKMLQLLEAIHRHLGLGGADDEARALADDTEIDDLAAKLGRELRGPTPR